ncbi:hypothetical protein JYU34_005521 [Plutella xylostella]|uniref:Uncharacterized protein n=1 Tax=Plutella xylostella TaxID=51655 RepID=A0ABQ7QTE4_PLUXY|nr:hypothetical protein JYU34_005521 [Plutella xylostella]
MFTPTHCRVEGTPLGHRNTLGEGIRNGFTTNWDPSEQLASDVINEKRQQKSSHVTSATFKHKLYYRKKPGSKDVSHGMFMFHRCIR